MLQNEYSKNIYDPCVYFRELSNKSIIYFLLYVDDMLIAAKSKVDLYQLKQQLSLEFDMKDLDATRKILGMEIFRDREACSIHLSQEQHVKKVLFRFGNAKSVTKHFANHFKLSASQSPKTEDDYEKMKNIPYLIAVGSLMYAMVCTKADIFHGVSVVSRYLVNPGKKYWQAVKWILRYFAGLVSKCLKFQKDGSTFVNADQVIGYTDFDFAGDLDKRIFLSGYVFNMSGAVISWKTKLQPTIVLSTTEAEYVALTETIKEAL